jgi:hypothetical protein
MNSYAYDNKVNHCPTLEQIGIMRVSKPWTHYYWAYNNDNKYFFSKEYTEDKNNGPAPPIEFHPELSSYNKQSKTLFCVYQAFTRIVNAYPTLINVGDY